MADSYDIVPYTSFTYAYTHPDTLCVLGRLFGLSPAAPRRCRVLELGCASGGNLIPMAEMLPTSEFVGLDRSAVQIDRGRALIGELGLGNIRLEQADILEVDPGALGTFDYVICHGVFAWVPRPVQDRILALTAAVLRPEGLAFISYNVYPGWHMRETARHMMRFHARRHTDPEQRVAQARALVDFVAGAVAERADQHDPYARLLQNELALLRGMSDSYLTHEHLEDDNTPLYFHEFCERLASVPLRYLCDTDLDMMVTRDMSEEVRATLASLADDQTSMEQYLDFVRNRQFRTTVLARIEAKPQRRLKPQAVERLRFCMHARPSTPAPSLEPGVELAFTGDPSIRSADSLTKAALLELCDRWPASVEFERLLELATARVSAAGIELSEPPRERLGADLVECLLRKAVSARAWEPPLTTTAPARPEVSAFSRAVAAREGWVASLHHRKGKLDAPLEHVIPLLDGTRDRAQLLAEIAALAVEGTLKFRNAEGEVIHDEQALADAQAGFLDRALVNLLGLPLLLDPNRATSTSKPG